MIAITLLLFRLILNLHCSSCKWAKWFCHTFILFLCSNLVDFLWRVCPCLELQNLEIVHLVFFTHLSLFYHHSTFCFEPWDFIRSASIGFMEKWIIPPFLLGRTFRLLAISHNAFFFRAVWGLVPCLFNAAESWRLLLVDQVSFDFILLFYNIVMCVPGSRPFKALSSDLTLHLIRVWLHALDQTDCPMGLLTEATQVGLVFIVCLVHEVVLELAELGVVFVE